MSSRRIVFAVSLILVSALAASGQQRTIQNPLPSVKSLR
jgi:hypothetical protein